MKCLVRSRFECVRKRGGGWLSVANVYIGDSPSQSCSMDDGSCC